MYKRQGRRRGPRTDDWLMTYADMITLLLCFFAIFLSVSVPKDEQMEQAREKVRERFAAQNVIDQFVLDPISPVGANSSEKEIYDRLPSIVDMYEKGEGVHIEQEGDRITTIEMDSSAFFASGSSVLSDEGQKILGELQAKLTGKDYINYSITVEGHTDDNPIHTAQFPSNWELSTSRAASVVRFFLEHGIDPERLRAAGYADVFPKVPNRDSNGNAIPANQSQNRRVVIKLEKIEKNKKK
ncbi:MAG TPA: OmpA family protein [Alphaproteobacteria bacterium]|nr:OmpA family protein [Micavibrio sp.]HQX26415.1 OmpA family protein [Alphaproteobacteria bacterium]